VAQVKNIADRRATAKLTSGLRPTEVGPAVGGTRRKFMRGAESVKIADIMSTAVEFVAANAAVKEAAELMGELDVGAVPVGSETDLEGILTDRDILFRVVAAGLDCSAVLVRDVLSRPAIICRETDDVRSAMDLMAANHIRRLPVENDHGLVTGWITLADIARKLLVDNHGLQTALSDMTEGEPAA